MRSAPGLAIALVVTAILPGSLLAQSGQRQSDKDVKQLIEDVDQARDRFEDQLDGNVKNSILRGAGTEVNVKQYLEDLQQDVKKLKERFTPQYAASTELQTVLRKASDIDGVMRQQPNTLKGSSEWDRLAMQLGRLAEAYRASFPLKEGASVRRINDGEAASAAAAVAENASRLKGAIGKEKGMAAAQRDAFKKDLDQLEKQAKAARSKTRDGKPATAEVREVVDLTMKLASSLQGVSLQPSTGAAWSAMRGPVEKLEQAFGMVAPR